MDKENIHMKKLHQGPGITVVEQMFSRLQIPPPKLEQSKDTENNQVKVSLLFSDDQISSLAKLGFEFGKELCSCTRNYAKQATKDLYDRACNVMASKGLTHHWAKKWKSDRDMEAQSLQPWKNVISDYLRRNNMYYMYKVPGQCNLDDALYSIRIFGVKNNSVQSSELLMSAWTSVDKERATLFALSKLFPQVSTKESVLLNESVERYFSSMGIDNGESSHSDTKVWIRDLRHTLNRVFKTFIDNKELREKMLDANSMKSWMMTFTNETFNVKSNNISIAQLGHNVMKTTLAYQVLSVFPDGNPALLSNMNIYFIEGDKQAKLAEELGLHSVMRCRPRGMMNHPYFKGMALQAFLGMLSQMGMVGPCLCFKFVKVHFPKSVLTNPMAKIACPERTMTDIFKTLKLEAPVVVENTSSGEVPFNHKRLKERTSQMVERGGDNPIMNKVTATITLSLVISEASKMGLVSLGLPQIKQRHLGTVSGLGCKRLLKDLYRTALTKLMKACGLTERTAKYIRFFINLKYPPMRAYSSDIEKFVKKRGIEYIQVHTIEKVNRENAKYICVVGHMEKRKVLLKHVWSESGDRNKVLKEWLEETFGQK